jgi:hypothetical protein
MASQKYESNCSGAVFEAIVECFVRQLKEEMCADCTDWGGGGQRGDWAMGKPRGYLM